MAPARPQGDPSRQHDQPDQTELVYAVESQATRSFIWSIYDHFSTSLKLDRDDIPKNQEAPAKPNKTDRFDPPPPQDHACRLS